VLQELLRKRSQIRQKAVSAPLMRLACVLQLDGSSAADWNVARVFWSRQLEAAEERLS
jgi:hypothetical protein